MGSNIVKPLDQAEFAFKIVKDLGLIYATANSKSTKRYGIFKCPKCNTDVKMPVASAKKSKQCNSCKAKSSPLKHGLTGSKLYNIWKNMKNRCLNKNNPQSKDYLGRGITVCNDWLDFEKFKDWAYSNGYSENLTIDRIDNDLGYYPANCRFTTYNIQARNKRKLMATNTSGFRGITRVTNSSSWAAQIVVDNKHIHIGAYATKELAAAAYDKYVRDNKLEHTTNA